jgi:hypothetical protein
VFRVKNKAATHYAFNHAGKSIMKNILMIGFAIITVLLTNNTSASTPSADDLLRMARSGVDEEVLSAYIFASADAFDLSADDIITLKDLGVPSKVIKEALHHGHGIDTATAAETATVADETKMTTPDDAITPAPELSPAVSTSAAVAPSPDDQNISFFYESLYPYGNWFDIDGDWCWQPNAAVISPDWAPYSSQGHWVDSDWGWCWVSDYSWGWAPFHYGRWFRHRTHGWCWVPDNEWGPAWVSWRRGDDYCGWAPLPLHTRYVNNEGFYFRDKRVGDDFEFNLTMHDYFFVPTKNFSDPHPWMNMVPQVRAEEAYRSTGFIRNSYGFDHDHFINRGPAVDDISRASHRTITQITIANDDLKPGEPIRRGLLRENRLVIYKPAIAPAVPKNPMAVRLMLEKRPPVAPQQRKSPMDGMFLKRENNAAQQTLKNQRLKANNSTQIKFHLEQAAGYEADSKKKAEFQAEAEIQSMKAQQARNHVDNIKQWKPAHEQKPGVIMPQSRVVPQPTDGNREQVQIQVRTQIQNEARMEQQRQHVAEEMIRSHVQRTSQQGSAGHPQREEKQGNSTRNNRQN